MNRLPLANLSSLPASVQSPRGRPAGGAGIVRFSRGALHRGKRLSISCDSLDHTALIGALRHAATHTRDEN